MIEIYPVDSVIRYSNNRGLVFASLASFAPFNLGNQWKVNIVWIWSENARSEVVKKYLSFKFLIRLKNSSPQDWYRQHYVVCIANMSVLTWYLEASMQVRLTPSLHVCPQHKNKFALKFFNLFLYAIRCSV